MSDLAIATNGVHLVFSNEAEIVDMIAAEAITKGQAIYRTSAGKAGVADANSAGKEQFRGIALKAARAGQAVPILKRGYLAGFVLSGMDPDAVAYLSDTAGKLADAAGTLSVACGRVHTLTDPDATKVLYVEADWLRTWA